MGNQEFTDQRRRVWPVVVGCVAGAGLTALAAWLVDGPQRLHWPRPAPPAFEFLYRGHSVGCMRFSPDGRSLAVVTNENGFGGDKETERTRVYRVPDGSVAHEIEDGARMCAWNRNGSLLAVASPSGEQFDVWDTRTWSRKNRLSVGFLEADKKLKAFLSTTICQLCFDGQGDLYAALSVNTDMGGNREPFDRARVWWDASDGKGAPKAERIGSYFFAFDLATATHGSEVRVAISCLDPDDPIEILSVRTEPDGDRTVKREYKLSELGPPNSLPTFPAIRLTGDGEYLAVRSLQRFRFFRLFDNHAELLISVDDQINYGTIRSKLGSVLDVSVNGRFAAYLSMNSVRVVRLSDGGLAIEVPRYQSCQFALSPDGALLAVVDDERKSLRFYRVPQI
jgi:dipeptidyl aminopeptidase/acylaminoacyl peptidase